MGGASSKIVPGLEAVGGAVSEFFAPGNPIGLGLMGSGIGQLAGGAAGGSSGQALGGSIGGLAGLGGGALGGNSALASLGGGGSAPGAFPGPTATAADFASPSPGGAPSSGGGIAQLANSPLAASLLSKVMAPPAQQAPQQQSAPAPNTVKVQAPPSTTGTPPVQISPISAYAAYLKGAA